MQQALKWKHPSLAAGGRQKKCASRLWLECAAEGREKFRGLGTWLGLGLWGELKAQSCRLKLLKIILTANAN